MCNSEQTVSTHPGYILVERPPGYEVVIGEQSRALSEISAACDKAGSNKVLVVGPRTLVKLSAFDILELGREIAKLDLRLALAETHDASKDSVSLLESVVSTHGGAIQHFDNVSDAKNWLGIA